MGYRFYVSELLRMNAEGRTLGMSYLEFRDYKRPEEKSAEEIISEVVSAAGIVLEG